MFRNYFAAALRHLVHSRLYVLIGVGGLAIGLCATLIAALVIRNQYSYDHFIPGYERTYIVQTAFSPPGMSRQYAPLTPLVLAAQIEARFAQVEGASRVLDSQQLVPVQIGANSFREAVYWADPDFLDVLPLPLRAGDSQALRQADGVILSRSYARRFFARDAPLGETLTIDGHSMVVRAIIEDPPANGTHAARHIIAAAIASFSLTSAEEHNATNRFGPAGLGPGSTYVRLKPGASIHPLVLALPDMAKGPDASPILSLELTRIDRLNTDEGLHPGFRGRMELLAMLGGVVLLMAAVNFVNLQTARAARRAREVAIRKLAGASRGTLIAQFLGEAVLYGATAALLALALAEWLLPHVNAFLDTGATIDYLRQPWPVAMLAAAAILLGTLAGVYPAFVLSAFLPVNVLRGPAASPARTALRQSLVTLQFALLIGLAICAGVVHQQREFAMHDALRVNGDQVLMMPVFRTPALADEIRKLPGVLAVTHASTPFLGSTGFRSLRGISISTTENRKGESVSVNLIGVDFDLFDFYGIKPLAGRLPSVDGRSPAVTAPDYVVLNETAARRFGLGTPAQALEQELPFATPGHPGTPENPTMTKVLAVVPDFSLGPVTEPIPPMVYFQPERPPDLVTMRLAGRAIPETLAAIDALWKKAGNSDPPLRFFLNEHMQRQYQGVLRQSQAFGICALIAVALSCMGLFALTAATVERRTKEIGIRKALGAETADVARLLLWQFSRPVLWANLLAWPAAAFLMQRWLQGFAYRIDLPLWLFPVAAAAAMAIALATVCVHCLLVARAKPVVALRYE